MQHLGDERDLAFLGGIRVHELDAIVVAIARAVADNTAEYQCEAIERNAQLDIKQVTDLQLNARVHTEATLVQFRSSPFSDPGAISGFEYEADWNIKVVPLPATLR